MEPLALRQPTLIGRAKESAMLGEAMAEATGGRGRTVFIGGEAGIGKTRLVSEFLSSLKGATVLRGWCLPDCLEPLMPIKEALRGAGMAGLMLEKPPPRILSAYVLNDAGMLYAQAERTKTGMDADIFAAMLRAVSSFITDSLGMMGKAGSMNGVSKIGQSGYNIVILSRDRMSLAVVLEGEENEFLIDDMGREIAGFLHRLNPDIYRQAESEWLEERLAKFVNSEKYSGEFLLDDPKLKLENMFDSVLLGIQRASEKSPVVLFLDDAQWADPTSLGLFHYLARNTRDCRVLLLATYRPEDLVPGQEGKAHPLESAMQNMSREALFTEMELSRLGASQTGEIIGGALGGCGLERGFAERIHTEAEGNPLFTLEILKLMVAEGTIRPEGGAWIRARDASDTAMPTKVYDVIRRRLDRLGREELDILECASVIGEKFGAGVLALSLGMGRLPLLKSLGRIEREHRLIHSVEGGHSFDHSKIRDVLYEGMGDELRSEYHATVANAYLGMFAGREAEIAEELAHHKFLARAPDAAHYLAMAGDKAKARFANEEAVRCFSLALGLTLDPGEKAPILEKLGDLFTVTGHCASGVERYTEALGLAQDVLQKAELCRKISMAHDRQSMYDLGIAAAERGLAMLGPEPVAIRSGLLAALAWNHIKKGNYDEAMRMQETSLENATALGDGKEIGIAHHQMGIISWFRGRYDEALAHYLKALEFQTDPKNRRDRENTLNNIGVIYMETGRLDEALAYFESGLEYEEMVGDKDGQAGTLDNLGNLYHTKGDLEKALGYHLRGLELYRMAGDRNGVAWSLSSLGYAYPDLGDVRKGIECFKESAGICREIGDQHILVYNLYGLADQHAKIGENEEAMEYVQMALKASRELGARREEGASIYILGCIQRNLGRFAESRQSFEQARGILMGVGDTSMLTMIDFDSALLLAKEGRTADAKELLEKALDSFRKMGMGVWVRKGEEELARLAGKA